MLTYCISEGNIAVFIQLLRFGVYNFKSISIFKFLLIQIYLNHADSVSDNHKNISNFVEIIYYLSCSCANNINKVCGLVVEKQNAPE